MDGATSTPVSIACSAKTTSNEDIVESKERIYIELSDSDSDEDVSLSVRKKSNKCVAHPEHRDSAHKPTAVPVEAGIELSDSDSDEDVLLSVRKKSNKCVAHPELRDSAHKPPAVPVEAGLFNPINLMSDDDRDDDGSGANSDVSVETPSEHELLAHGDRNLLASLNRSIPNASVPYAQLTRQQFTERCLAYRERAQSIFKNELLRQKSSHTTEDQASCLEYTLVNGLQFDKGSKRRGVCKWYTRNGRPKRDSIRISFSARLIDFGCPAKEVLLLSRHELAHAANPGAGHGPVWQAYNIKVGGDGKRCDQSGVTRAIIGHKIDIYCETIANEDGAQVVKANGKHVLQEKQKRPTPNKLRRYCVACREEGKDGRLFWRRVSLASTAQIQ